MLKDKKNVVIVVLLCVVLVMIVKNIWSDTNVTTNDYETKIKKLEQSIATKQLLISTLRGKADSIANANTALHHVNDSLDSVKQKVKHIYHGIYKDLNTYSNKRLDSVIRSNW